MKQPPATIDFQRLSRADLTVRDGHADVRDFARPPTGGMSFAAWFDSLPKLGQARRWRALIDAAAVGRQTARSVHLVLDRAVPLAGLSPLIADLVRRGLVTALTVTDDFLAHEFEIAAVGATGPDAVPLAAQTGQALGFIAANAAADNLGLGEAAARFLAGGKFPYAERTALAVCHQDQVPVTVHATSGGSAFDPHPDVDAASLGAALARDQRVLLALLERLSGGLLLEVGDGAAAVVRPALRLAAAAGLEVGEFTHAAFLGGPVDAAAAEAPGRIDLSGPLELLLPLFAAALTYRLWDPAED